MQEDPFDQAIIEEQDNFPDNDKTTATTCGSDIEAQLGRATMATQDKTCGGPVGFWVVLSNSTVEVRCKDHCFTDEVVSSDVMQDPGDAHKAAPACQFIDTSGNRRDLIMSIVQAELDYQDAIFGRHRTQPASEWTDIIMEELGEASKALNDNEWQPSEAFSAELIQTAAAAIQCAIQMNRDHAITPPSREPETDNSQGSGEQGDVAHDSAMFPMRKEAPAHG